MPSGGVHPITQLSRSRRALGTASMGHQERFPPTRPSASCGFRKETIAGMRRNGRNAPQGAVGHPPGSSKMRRRDEATEFALDEPGEGNCGAIVKVAADDLHADR